jgi:hypothetical protein
MFQRWRNLPSCYIAHYSVFTLSSTSDIQAETQLLKSGSDQYDLLPFPFKHFRVEMPVKYSV